MANLKIKTWHLNSKEIDESEGEIVTDLLGHKWNKETDKFTFKREAIPELTETLTKRNCLALVAKLWDPIGITTPVTIRLRIDLQELWCSGFGWDDVIPTPVANNESSPIVGVRSEVKTNQCEFSTRSPWILRCR